MDKNGEPLTSIKLNDKRYEIEVNAYTLEEVRKELGIDVLRCFEDKDVFVKLGEAGTFIAALRIFMDDDCERNKTTDAKEFAKLFRSGDILEEAMDALLEVAVAATEWDDCCTFLPFCTCNDVQGTLVSCYSID